MKLLIFIGCFTFFACQGMYGQYQSAGTKKPGDQIEQYWFILLKTGAKTDFDSTRRAELFQGHMANMKRLYDEGILKVAGPFGKNDHNWRGLFIFDVKSREEAEKIANTDPAIASGLFSVDVVPWFGAPTGSFIHGKPKKEE